MKPNILIPIMIFMTRYYHSPKHISRLISVSSNSLNIFRLSLFLLIFYFLTSCEEGPTTIGSEMLPGSDFVNLKSIDTISVFSYINYDESIRTDNPSEAYIGQIYDPYFGTTTADFVSQIRMGSSWDDLPFIIDSVKLVLKLLNVTGKTTETHSLRISEISEQIYPDSSYYSDRAVPLAGYELPEIELPALRADTVNDISISLPVEFGYYLTRDTAQLFYSNTKSDFRSFFKGLFFQMNTASDPLLISLSLAQPTVIGNSYNYIILYMHDETGAYKNFYFILDAMNKNAAYDRFTHNFNTATLGNKMAHRNTTYKDTLSYLQYLNGVYTKITLPGLAKLKNDPSLGHFAVNKARLLVPVYLDGNIYKTTTVPAQLYLRYKTKDGSKYVVPDYSIDTDHAFFSGKLDTTALVYSFNIPSYVQGYLRDATGTIEPELEIFQGTGTQNVILRANNNKIPIKFQFTYTNF
jgi:hypothetical protein